MSTFNREELQDIVTAIEVVTGAYVEELEDHIKQLYRHDTSGFHRLRSVMHRLQAAINEVDEPA